MKIKPLIALLTASAMWTASAPMQTLALGKLTSNVSQTDPQKPVTYTLTCLDFNGNVFTKVTVSKNEIIDYSKIDTSTMKEHVDVNTERAFAAWDKTPTTITQNTTIKALSRTAVISLKQYPTMKTYLADKGKIFSNGLKVVITITTQTNTLDKDGKYKETVSATDITSTCTIQPNTLDDAFKNSDKATISVYPIGQNKSIGSYEINYVPNIGDVDESGDIDGSDAGLILSHYANNGSVEGYVPNEHVVKNGDINFDGSVDGSDASLALSFYALRSNNPDMTLDTFLIDCGLHP